MQSTHLRLFILLIDKKNIWKKYCIKASQISKKFIFEMKLKKKCILPKKKKINVQSYRVIQRKVKWGAKRRKKSDINYLKKTSYLCKFFWNLRNNENTESWKFPKTEKYWIKFSNTEYSVFTENTEPPISKYWRILNIFSILKNMATLHIISKATL